MWRVYKSETETTKQFEWNKNTVEYSNGLNTFKYVAQAVHVAS